MLCYSNAHKAQAVSPWYGAQQLIGFPESHFSCKGWQQHLDYITSPCSTGYSQSTTPHAAKTSNRFDSGLLNNLAQGFPSSGCTSQQSGCAALSPSSGLVRSPTPPPLPLCSTCALLCMGEREAEPSCCNWKPSTAPSFQPGNDCSSGSRSQKSLREAAQTGHQLLQRCQEAVLPTVCDISMRAEQIRVFV